VNEACGVVAPKDGARVELHLQGRLPLDRFVSETIPLDGVEDAFAKMQRGEVLRSVVVF
jgi:S-(hydroxymethyl)mycothiol dehydrogenase